MFFGPVAVIAILASVFGTQSSLNDDKKPVVASIKDFPAQQVEFCRIIDSDYATYKPEYDRYHDDSNGISRDEIGDRMNVIENNRNIQLYKLLSSNTIKFNGWKLRIEKSIKSKDDHDNQTVAYLLLEMMTHCGQEVTVTADLPLTPTLNTKAR